MADHDHVVENLRKRYCPPIDEGLFQALRLDYNDLTQGESLQVLRQTLDQIRHDAQVEEATGFDPSGTSGQMPLDKDPSPDSSADSTTKSSDRDVESLATGISELSWDDSVKNDRARSHPWETLSVDEKEQRLAELLPRTNQTTIRFTLRKNHDKFEESIDELLLLSFLDEDEKHNAESIESYTIGGYGGKSRKRRGKKNGNHNSIYDSVASSAHTSSESLPVRNVWAAGQEDIAFISSRTTLSPDVVGSLYHKHGTSLSATINALADQHSPSTSKIQSFDIPMQVNAADLGQDFPNLPQEHIFALLILTNNKPNKTTELLNAMLADPVPTSATPSKIIPHYAPSPALSEPTSVNTTGSRPSNSFTLVLHGDPSLAHLHATEQFNKASNAYRRGKSDRNFSAVAAYYSSLGREHLANAKAQSAALADSLVNETSTSNSIDLHGVTVADAVRIASSRVENWWDGLGDRKFVRGGGGGPQVKEGGFRIVTGVGRHSRDGAPRLGPAVTKRLMNEGWRVEVGQGELVVTGKRRH